jgi:hypothetical protein
VKDSKNKGGRGGARAGAGRKPDPERVALGREINLHILGLPGEVTMRAVEAVREGRESEARKLLDHFVYEKFRPEALTKVTEIAGILDGDSRVEEVPKIAVRVVEGDGPAKIDRPQRLLDSAAILCREVERMMNPLRISEAVNRSMAGTPPVIDGTTLMREEIRQSRLDSAKHAADRERGVWGWIGKMRHKRAEGTLDEEDLQPPNREVLEDLQRHYSREIFDQLKEAPKEDPEK